jgi:hypothetical protein
MNDLPPRSERIGMRLIWLALLCLALATVASLTDGFGFTVRGLRVSLHNPTNPLIATFVLGGLGIWLAGSERSLRRFDAAAQALATGAPWLALGLSVAVLVATIQCSAFYAGGADSSGYVSQARLWRQGHLQVSTPLATELTLNHGQHPFSPLGYRPAAVPAAVVPSYPPGFPLMLALAGVVHAERLVVPLCAAGLVLLAHVLGRRIGDSAVGLLSAAVTAASPILWYQAVQPMSDVPAAFWTTLSVVLLTSQSRSSAIGAGVALAIGGLVRPNLFAVAPVLALCAVWWDMPGPMGLRRAFAFGVPVVSAAAGFTAFQRAMYGAATETGYGGVSSLFSLDHVLPNLALYPNWLITTHTVGLLLAFVGPFAAGQGPTPAMAPARARRVAWSGLVFFVALLGFYALYFVFDEWVYIRFLLPALPWLFTLVALAIGWVCRRAPFKTTAFAVIVSAVIVLNIGIGRARGAGAFRIAVSEHRYVDVANYVHGLPPEVVILAMQHSGSVSYYTDKPILRWDWIEPEELEHALTALAATGRPVYGVLEDWEMPRVAERFPGTRLAHLPAPLFSAGVPEGIRAHVYALSDTTGHADASTVSSIPQ